NDDENKNAGHTHLANPIVEISQPLLDGRNFIARKSAITIAISAMSRPIAFFLSLLICGRVERVVFNALTNKSLENFRGQIFCPRRQGATLAPSAIRLAASSEKPIHLFHSRARS